MSPEPVTASAWRSMSEQALLQAAAGKGVLHHGEADQQDDQDEAAAKRWLHDVVVQLPVTVIHDPPARPAPSSSSASA
jgi:hypothetical protein